MDEDDASDLSQDPLGVGRQDSEVFMQTERNDKIMSQSSAVGTPRRTEPKVSLSEYHTTRSLSSSGAGTDIISNNTKLAHDSSVNVVNADISVRTMDEETVPKTSTPVRPDININPAVGAVGFSPVRRRGTGNLSTVSSCGSNSATRRVKRVSFVDPLDIRVPLVGFEVMEQRAKFTVFKLHVHKGTHDNWFVFRRFSDFVQLQQNLKNLFPMFHLPLPPKRWFRNNYERDFIEDRMLGLQAFVDSLLCHSDLCNSVPVQEFFCFSDPPGPHDSVEESRAYCDELEDAVYNLKKELHSKDTEIELLREELGLYKSQVEMLTKALREANTTGATNGHVELSPSNSLAECDLMAPAVDQSKPMSLKDEIDQSEMAALRALKLSQSDTQELEKASAVPLNYNSDGIANKEANKRKSRILPSS